jgi:hypothetical protein
MAKKRLEEIMEMEIGYNLELKKEYKKEALKFFYHLHKRFNTICGSYDVKIEYNPGGIAVAGDVSMKARLGMYGLGVHIMLCSDVPPRGLLFRSIENYQDHVGGINHFIHHKDMVKMSYKNMAEHIAKTFNLI